MLWLGPALLLSVVRPPRHAEAAEDWKREKDTIEEGTDDAEARTNWCWIGPCWWGGERERESFVVLCFGRFL